MKRNARWQLKLREVLPLSQVESPADPGSQWEVTVFAYGRSQREPFFVYTAEAAQRSLEVFRGARVYANTTSTDFGHTEMANKSPRDIVGMLVNPVVAGDGFRATLSILPSASWLKENLLHAVQHGLPMPYELSIDAKGSGRVTDYQGEQLPVVEQFFYAALDVVERGAAGGAFQSLKESLTEGPQMKDKLLKLLREKYGAYFAEKHVDEATVTEDQLADMVVEASALAPAPVTPITPAAPVTPAEPVATEAALAESRRIQLDVAALRGSVTPMEKRLAEMEKVARFSMLESKLVTANLPAPLAKHLRESFQTRDFTEKDVDAEIARTRATFSKFVEGLPSAGGLDIRAGMQDVDKVRLGIDGFFLEKSLKPLSADERTAMLKGVPAFRSIREAYRQLTGDMDVTGLRRNMRFTESLVTSDWAQVVADAMNKRMVRDYAQLDLAGWRDLPLDVVPLNDFKTQHRIRYGGYANLPVRPQRGAYQPVTSPTDEEATYTPATYGGTEDLTREMIMNDDVGAVQRIPQRMARAAAQTLYEFVLDFVRPGVNPTIYDNVALYHSVSHANTGTAALASDAVAFNAAQLAIKKQTDGGNSKRLGLRPGVVWVPADLEAIAWALTFPAAGNYNNVPTFAQQSGVVPKVVPYWTDATDWLMTARREDIVGMEIGFVNGQENPELFVSDVANVGSWFTNDVLTYKIRHEYGGAIIDYRAFYGAIVT